MKSAVVFEVTREAYGIEDVRRPLTVRQVINALEEFDDDTLFIISNDEGYTYGKLTDQSYWEQTSDDEEFEKLW